VSEAPLDLPRPLPGTLGSLRPPLLNLLLFLSLSDGVEATPVEGERRFVGLHRSRGTVARLSALFGLDALAGGLVANPRFVIPAYDGNAEVRATQKIVKDTLVTTLTPHMHVRGKDMIYIAHYADGTTETLLSVPKYDFNWQITYELAKPKLLPAGTELEVIAHYDNSANNRFNPDPSKDVRWGDQTWEEMMIGFYGTVIDRPAATQER